MPSTLHSMQHALSECTLGADDFTVGGRFESDCCRFLFEVDVLVFLVSIDRT